MQTYSAITPRNTGEESGGSDVTNVCVEVADKSFVPLVAQLFILELQHYFRVVLRPQLQQQTRHVSRHPVTSHVRTYCQHVFAVLVLLVLGTNVQHRFRQNKFRFRFWTSFILYLKKICQHGLSNAKF